MTSLDWAKPIARRDEKHLTLGIWCVLYWRFYGSSNSIPNRIQIMEDRIHEEHYYNYEIIGIDDSVGGHQRNQMLIGLATNNVVKTAGRLSKLLRYYNSKYQYRGQINPGNLTLSALNDIETVHNFLLSTYCSHSSCFVEIPLQVTC